MARGPDVAVVLSGGASSRMGTPKALLRDAQGRTFLSRVTGTLERAGCAAVLVVAGRHVAELAPALPQAALLVYNAGWERGQLSSAQAGLAAALRLGPGRVVLHVVDQPLVTAGDVRRVLAALGRADLSVAVHRDQTGHPIALSAAAARRVAQARGDNLREVLEQVAPRRVLALGCSAGCVRGANTPAELERLLGKAESKPAQ